MEWIRYIGAILCILLAIGTIPSVFLIAEGLIDGQTSDFVYFAGKLAMYVIIILLLLFLSVKLLKKPKSQ